jgi:ParB family chromosome partitioning protein
MSNLANIPVDSISVNPHQPRKEFDEDAMKGLQQSISRKGILHPIIVQKSTEKGVYFLVDGERRWRAAKLLGFSEIPAIIQAQSNDVLERALISNLQREDLSVIEEKGAYKEMLDRGYNEAGIADVLGVRIRRIKNRLNYKPSKSKKSPPRVIVGLELLEEVRDALLNDSNNVELLEKIEKIIKKKLA